jgi:hypothetical protein
MCWSSWRSGSSPALRESWLGHDSMTSGVPKTSATWGQVDVTIVDYILDCGKDKARQRARRIDQATVPARPWGLGHVGPQRLSPFRCRQ